MSWRSGAIIGLGAALLVTVSLGPMAAELGNISAVIWLVTAVIGALQCVLIAQLARRYPRRAGGTATYAHLALRDIAWPLGGLSSWAYWFGWTPGIAVNAVVAGDYLSIAFDFRQPLVLAILIIAVQYAINYAGLKTSMKFSAAVAAIAAVPLMLILFGAITHPAAFHLVNLLPLAAPGHLSSARLVPLAIKWAFVAVWSSYGAEMASAVIAEMAEPQARSRLAIGTSAITGMISFTVIPAVLISLIGSKGLQADAMVVFLAPAQLLFGNFRTRVVAIMLAAALVLSSQAFIISSSRTIYQMSRDGYLPRSFSKLNRFSVPVGSIAWDACVIAGLLLIFRNHVVDVVASANVGYVLVFVLLPVAYLILRKRGELALPDGRTPRRYALLALSLAAFNTILLAIGAAQWGWRVVGTAVVVLAAVAPMMITARRLGRHRAMPR